ncbi:glycine-rich protein [Musa troglodytarum]|uniref:Glycine-rich protein n=1 Tax=Musa troglodytarum TaxID=320322 RepID=A0A9E7L7U0_9LILI|nr:glycine-rich protein [Musa troglodytarum]
MLAAATKKKLGLLALSRYVLLPRVSPPPRHREPQRLRPASATTLRCLYRPPPPVRSKVWYRLLVVSLVIRCMRLWRQGMCLMPFWPCCKASALAGHVTISYAISYELASNLVGNILFCYLNFGILYMFLNLEQPFSWETLKKAVGGFSFRRELTVQDMLRERAQERQFDGNGGDGISGGGGGGGDGSGGPEDEGFAGQFDELVQVIMAVIVVVLLYVLMISGEEVTRLVRDYIKYLFGAKPSVRLTRAMKKWRKFYRSVARKGVVREDWLEREIVLTPTWWHKPRWLAFVVRTYYERYGNQNH